MWSFSRPQTPVWPVLAWSCAAVAGFAAPALAMLHLADAAAPAPLVAVVGPVLAVGLMGVAMIAAAAAGRMWIGVALGLLAGLVLLILARALGLPPLPHPLSTGFAVIVASISFAARGALFAKSASDKGWLIAVSVVAGETAILFTAAAMPAALPDWLLALLPAQWASTAISGSDTQAAIWPLFALAGTAAATLLVIRLWPRRWPYLIMFSAWLALSALVWLRPGAPSPEADRAFAADEVLLEGKSLN